MVAAPVLFWAYDLWTTNLWGARCRRAVVILIRGHAKTAAAHHSGGCRTFGAAALCEAVYGTNVVNVFGGDYTALYLDEIDFGDVRPKFLHDYHFAVDAKRPLFSDLKFRRLSGPI